MRYFLLILLLTTVALLSIAGFRGSTSHRPPLEVFPDMKRQPKLRPQASSTFFANLRSSQLEVPGTIARGAPYEDTPVNTGWIPGTTNFVETIPVPMTAELMARGQERYEIYCLPCHSPIGDGNGIVTKYGMLRTGNYHDARFVKMTDGEIFNTITYGKNLMPPYAAQVSIPDRWAIIAYVRALQRSRLASLEDVPEPLRPTLKK
jgi:mono/diheme cytochrome c family protein